MKRIYISGKISGLDLAVAKELFDAASEELKQNGHMPLNPMALVPYNDTWAWEDYMKEDIKFLMDCDGICMLDNWKESKGAVLEHDLAVSLNMIVIYRAALEVA